MRRLFTELIENLRLAWAQLWANKTRSALTALGVIIGTLAVTLMGTAINGIDAVVERSFAGFGEDVLYVSKSGWFENLDWSIFRNRRNIRASYADDINSWIAAHPDGPLRLAVPAASRIINVSRGEFRVNNIFLLGTTAEYPRISRSEMKEGRFFSAFEDQTGSAVVLLGYDVANALFPGRSAVDQLVRIRDQNFRVVGVAARQGSFFGLFSWDSMAAIPLSAYRRSFSSGDTAELRVQVEGARLEAARDELRGLMRRIRQLQPEERDDFGINEQAAIRGPVERLETGVTVAGLFITGLALFVGAIGIMNITFVSVRERTREIGTRKALGARRTTILLQFLIEAVLICVVGGMSGVVMAGAIARIARGVAPSLPLVFSPGLVVLAVAVSFVAGVLSGIIPAFLASRLNPVDALRYE